MHNGFSCYYETGVGDNDKQVSTVLGLHEVEEGIKLDISRKDEVQSGTTFREQKSTELILNNLSTDQLLRIVELLEDWLTSESYPTMDIEIKAVEGVHNQNNFEAHRYQSPRVGTEFTGITISVSESDIRFAYWDDSSEEWRDLSIPTSEDFNNGVPQDINNVTDMYKTLYDFFEIEYSETIEYFDNDGPASSEKTAVYQIEQIFNRFSEIVIPLQNRRSDREPLTMDDEADVQYLLHSFLKLYFDDVRREPHTERHSSVSPRIDFLVQDETIGVEVKRASPTRQEKSLRSELSEDKEQYRLDTNIDTLLIFVYDPEKQIENKAEFEDSFEQKTPQMETRMTITR